MQVDPLAAVNPDPELELGNSAPIGFEKAKVLLVDDSRLIRMGLRRSLKKSASRTSSRPATAAKPSKRWCANTLT